MGDRPIGCAALIALGAIFAVTNALAVPRGSLTPEQEKRAVVLEHALGCPACGGKSVADAPAGVADHLREILRERIQLGQDDGQVVDFLHRTYGTFVMAASPNPISPILLWGLPVIFGGWAFGVASILRQKPPKTPQDSQGKG
ncbi:MAG: cytochrome c-type biogenesis protein CcmH [Alphaproteobacteria bacterium]|nr:cytochrome c-type biogenesis protein CcmH [Alphaproteobacteria bacterium]